jgi:hypothetical protein
MFLSGNFAVHLIKMPSPGRSTATLLDFIREQAAETNVPLLNGLATYHNPTLKKKVRNVSIRKAEAIVEINRSGYHCYWETKSLVF